MVFSFRRLASEISEKFNGEIACTGQQLVRWCVDIEVSVAKEKNKAAHRIEDKKKRGEWVELRFMASAAERGLPASKPFGDSENFDVVVGRPGKFVAVQVKSTAFECGGGYSCAVKHNNRAYARGSFDFVAAYVIPEDTWYIVPAAKMRGKQTMILCSDAKQALYEEYREAWELLRAAVGVEEGTEPPAEEEVAEAATAEEKSPAPVLGRMQEIEKRMRRFYGVEKER